MVNVNEFKGNTDSEIIRNAINNRDCDGIVLIPPRVSSDDSTRSHWLIDEAVLLPSDTTIIMQNSTIKLSDSCRDNFFRTANCGPGIEFPEKVSNIHIKGEGLCTLEGADNPRASGDPSKTLHAPCPHMAKDICRIADWVPEERRKSGNLDFWDFHGHTYGTDALKPDESQCGDWRSIGVLFACAENFSVSNLKISGSHGWGISLEDCSFGRVEKIRFDSCMYREIDGMLMNIENQDGLDIRNGCHHIVVSDITGCTGDDVIALTAIANPDNPYMPGGSLEASHIVHNDWTKRDKNIHDIIIRNVAAYSNACFVIRLLPVMTQIYNIIIDTVIDTAPRCTMGAGTVLLGESGMYGEDCPDSIKNISISNIICNSNNAIIVSGFLTDSTISNVINKNPLCPAITIKEDSGMKNVVTNNII